MTESRQSYYHKHRVQFFGPPSMSHYVKCVKGEQNCSNKVGT